MVEPTLDGAAIQGDVLPGFHRRQQWLIALRADDAVALRQAILRVLPEITSTVDVLRHRAKVAAQHAAGKQAGKHAGHDGWSPPKPPAMPDPLWSNLALAHDALIKLGFPEIGGL